MRKPTYNELYYIAARLEAADRDEVEAVLGHFDPAEVASILHAKTGICDVLLENGIPYMAGGYEIVEPGVAESWMITTRLRDRHILDITRASLRVMRQLERAGITEFRTYADARKTRAHDWYRTLGLERTRELPAHHNGYDFVLFTRRAA